MHLLLPPFSIKPQYKQLSHPPSNINYMEWQLQHIDRDMLMGVLLSHRPSDLLDNCDLPPPLKLFSPTEITPQAPISMKDDRYWSRETALDHAGSMNANLMRALQLSQTRAREAEKNFMHEREVNKEMAALLLEESMRLYAHRQWMKMLEVEVTMVKQKKGLKTWIREDSDEEPLAKEMKAWRREDSDEDPLAPAATRCLALALCLSIAALGFALGRYMP